MELLNDKNAEKMHDVFKGKIDEYTKRREKLRKALRKVIEDQKSSSGLFGTLMQYAAISSSRRRSNRQTDVEQIHSVSSDDSVIITVVGVDEQT